jgi:Uma2 family endonuclease
MITETLEQITELEETEETEEVADGISGELSVVFGSYLVEYVYPRKLGRVYGADTDFELPNIGKRRPDIAFCKASTLAHSPRTAIPVPPDLAVEVVSSRDEFDKLSKKLQEYKQANVKLIWVIRPLDQEVEVRRLDGTKSLLGVDDILKGEDVIPNFEIAVSKIFEGLA